MTRKYYQDAIMTAFSMDGDFDQLVKKSKFYSKLKEESYQAGFRLGLEQARKEAFQKERLMTVATIIRKGLVSLETAIETLHLTPAEVAAIQALLQQSSNGNH